MYLGAVGVCEVTTGMSSTNQNESCDPPSCPCLAVTSLFLVIGGVLSSSPARFTVDVKALHEFLLNILRFLLVCSVFVPRLTTSPTTFILFTSHNL